MQSVQYITCIYSSCFIIGNPSITLCSSMFTKIEGTSKPFSFAVILNGNPKPSINDIIWYFNDELIDLKQLKMEILEFFIAQVAHVAFTVPNGYHREQTGVYTAVVNTTAGITNSSFRLEVLSKYTIIIVCIKPHLL